MVSYLVSSRPDLVIGSFLLNTFEYCGAKKTESIASGIVESALEKDSVKETSVFLSGINANYNYSELKVELLGVN